MNNKTLVFLKYDCPTCKLIHPLLTDIQKKNTSLEIIPTTYLLIDGGRETSVQRVSKTLPMKQENVQAIVNTALAGEYSGKQLIYLEAGSGASTKVSTAVISAVKKEVSIPIIVGGGIRSEKEIKQAYQAGATMVVVGTAFEDNPAFLVSNSASTSKTVEVSK